MCPPLMPHAIAEQTRGGDVSGLILAAILPSLQMFSRRSQKTDQGSGEVVSLCKLRLTIPFPHGKLAVIAAAVLSLECLAAK